MAFNTCKDPSIWEARATSTSAVDGDTAMADNPARPKTLAELLKADLRLNADKKMRNVQYEELRELREARDNIDFEIEDTEAVLEAADAFIRQKQVENQADVHVLGLSSELLKAYADFCESLYSQCRGFSILCDHPHHGSYFGYDPEFCFFKQFAEEQEQEKMELKARLEEMEERMREKDEEMGTEVEEEDGEDASTDQDSDMEIAEAEENYVGEDELDVKLKEHVHWTNRNFRCEASVSVVPEFDGSERTEQIVEFWPLPQIEPRSGVEVTWGEQYPELYRLAIYAAKNGSEAAMEILMRLPSMSAEFKGWLFEYEFEESLKDEPLLSRRWVFKEARKIEEPGTVVEKEEGLVKLIAAYGGEN